MPPTTARALGRRGERCARRALKRVGFRILATNVVTPYGEVDLLALEGETLVLVEVKTSTSGRPARLLRPPQRRRLRRAARWLAHRGRRRIRRDLVEVSFDGRRPLVRIHRGRA